MNKLSQAKVSAEESVGARKDRQFGCSRLGILWFRAVRFRVLGSRVQSFSRFRV